MDTTYENISPADTEYDELDEEFDSDNEDPNVFHIRDPLQPPSAKIYSTAQLHALIHEGVIDLNPSYQRDVVWPETKQIGLIDSIFRNFYIPPVVFAVQKDPEGEEVRVCVDGKQRLTSIQKFFDGQVKKFWYTTPDSSKGLRHEVPETWKKQFSQKQITCVEYYDIPPGTEREIFQRVQLGVTLTAAEKLQAISSPWAEWVSGLEARHVAVEGGLTDVLTWDTKRGRNFQNLAHLVYCCDGVPEEERLPTAQKIEKWLSRTDHPSEKFKMDMEQVLQDYWRIAQDDQLNRGFKKIPAARVAPVEFIFIGVLLYVLKKRSYEDRGNAIYGLRQHVRSAFKDVRNNTNVAGQLHLNPSVVPFNDSGSAKGRKKRKVLPAVVDEEYKPAKRQKGRVKQAKTS
ncbi:hypothetical protein BDQ17DRAFT_1349335 [Cyathus striatus]|nr:hypothetical protein BDQ17DRAFT_1349335 [Cyathus striatus]